MPELPEVETIRLSLEPQLRNRVITGGVLSLPKLIQGLPAENFLETVTGKQVQRMERRGKYLMIYLNENYVIVVHLRMTGQLVMEKSGIPPVKATHLILNLDNGFELHYRDQRKFGRIWLVTEVDLPGILKNLGPEPLTVDFTPEVFQKQLSRHRLAIKKSLLNQEIIAGLGNIYTDEALFLAGIHPARDTHTLTEQELSKLYIAIRRVLGESIQQHGTTKRDYCDGDGNPGSYQKQLQVYGRKGQSCFQCGNMIVRMTLGGRGTHFCPLCQS